MERKVKAKVIKYILDNKRIIKEFDEYIHSKKIYNELITPSAFNFLFRNEADYDNWYFSQIDFINNFNI